MAVLRVGSCGALASMPLTSMVWVGGAFQRNTALMKPATPAQVLAGGAASTNTQ
jgi:hypothetical protein